MKGVCLPVKISLLHACWLGRVPYRQAWRLQTQLAAQIAADRQPPTLLLLEHPHTYTLGRSGSWDNLLWDQEQLDQHGVETFEVDRGGDITYHGPGQLVAYPLLPLGQVSPDGRLPGPDYHGYLRQLESVMIHTLAAWGLTASALPGLTGVWLASQTASGKPPIVPAKIGAIGVKVDAHGISRHGAALNIAPEMNYFEGIIPCGIAEHPVTSMAECLAQEPPAAEVRRHFLEQFQREFGGRVEMVSADDLLAKSRP
jgi:lipoate-protein ligase B